MYSVSPSITFVFPQTRSIHIQPCSFHPAMQQPKSAARTPLGWIVMQKRAMKSRSHSFRVQELCESRGGRPGLSVPTSFTVSVEVKQRWTVLRHWSQFGPNMSTDVRGHEALLLHHHHHHHHHHLESHAARAQRVCSRVVSK